MTFEIYFLAIVATSLRYDERICIGVGLLTVAQYAALWAFAAFRYDLSDPVYAQGLGEYSIVDQTTAASSTSRWSSKSAARSRWGTSCRSRWSIWITSRPSTTPLATPQGEELTITCSAGIAELPIDGLDAGTLLARADQRLLAAKRAGRDRLHADDAEIARRSDFIPTSVSG